MKSISIIFMSLISVGVFGAVTKKRIERESGYSIREYRDGIQVLSTSYTKEGIPLGLTVILDKMLVVMVHFNEEGTLLYRQIRGRNRFDSYSTRRNEEEVLILTDLENSSFEAFLVKEDGLIELATDEVLSEYSFDTHWGLGVPKKEKVNKSFHTTPASLRDTSVV